MRRSLTIVVLLLVLAVSLGLYRLETEVKILERRLANVTTQLEDPPPSESHRINTAHS